MSLRQRQPRKHDNKHLDFIRSLPCVICGDDVTVEAAHVRMIDPSIAKPMTGMGTKADDMFTLPLCGHHHREQHKIDEERFWDQHGIDPVKRALALYAISGDHWRGRDIALASRDRA